MPAHRRRQLLRTGLTALCVLAPAAPAHAGAGPAPCSASAAWSCTVTRALASAQAVRWELSAPGSAVATRSLAAEPPGPARTAELAAGRTDPAVLRLHAAPGSHVVVQAVGAETGAEARRWDVEVPGSGAARIAWDGTARSGRSPAGGRYVFRLSRADAADPAPVETTDVEVGDGGVFPIRGPHDLGHSRANQFGGGRGHKGLDMFAACGTPIVAAMGGKVEKAAFEGAAGNYLVITLPDGRSHVYMHLRSLPRVRAGEHVDAGQRIGAVGQTGDAEGCHLHFELWTAPGWFRGRVVDPRPTLARWDARS